MLLFVLLAYVTLVVIKFQSVKGDSNGKIVISHKEKKVKWK